MRIYFNLGINHNKKSTLIAHGAFNMVKPLSYYALKCDLTSSLGIISVLKEYEPFLFLTARYTLAKSLPAPVFNVATTFLAMVQII
jgi:hypothetical protein